MQNKIEFKVNTKSEEKLEAGQFWRRENELYILSKLAEDKFSLVSLSDGDRYVCPTQLQYVFGISRREFTLVTSPFTVTPE